MPAVRAADTGRPEAVPEATGLLANLAWLKAFMRGMGPAVVGALAVSLA